MFELSTSEFTLSLNKGLPSNSCMVDIPADSVSCHDLTIVLSAKLSSLNNQPGGNLEIEAHVSVLSSLQDTATKLVSSGKARVTHIVIRLDPRYLELWEPTHEHTIAAIEMAAAQLPHLQFVTLEILARAESLELTDIAGKFHVLQDSGKLRVLTCADSERIAEEAQRFHAGSFEDHGVISPLWYSNKNERDRQKWYLVSIPTLARQRID